MQRPRRVSIADPLKEMEAEAYETAEDLPAEPPPNSKDGTVQFAPAYRLQMLRPWPFHTDFRPDNLSVRD